MSGAPHDAPTRCLTLCTDLEERVALRERLRLGDLERAKRAGALGRAQQLVLRVVPPAGINDVESEARGA